MPPPEYAFEANQRAPLAEGKECEHFGLLRLPRVPWQLPSEMLQPTPAMTETVAVEAGSGNSHIDIINSPVAAAARDAILTHGGVLLQGLTGNSTLLDETRTYLAWKASRPKASFTEYVHLAKHRHHLRLHPDEHPTIAALFTTLLGAAATVLLPLASPLGAVVEFAAFLSNPGAEGQRYHADSGNTFSSFQAPVYSFFLFLSDVDSAENGPLQVVPASHALSKVRDSTNWGVQRLERSANDASKRCTEHWKLCPIKAGDAVIYDATSLHRGTANWSNRTRIVVYISVLGVGDLPLGQTFAIHNSLLVQPRRLADVFRSTGPDERGAAARMEL